MAKRNRKDRIKNIEEKEKNTMNDLDKVYAESVAKDYMPKETNKVRQLKKLDERAKLPAFISAMTLGIIGTLIFGAGMCFGLSVFGTGEIFMVIGVLLGIVGAAISGINYPLYKKLLKKGKEKYAFEILELAKEITGEAQ
ncbi:AtpZ/AtpI family protein [Butyrivibrio sp. AE2032]|uniref:AtpZ/AtpI family protein n=1 Tax=Butyrivibrio sp. AE2032 TaxID=1458463 RepID=UPI001FA6B2BF|nr:AtpZ/AtpI family protein [Butyrivibrio sp. AE2032]